MHRYLLLPVALCLLPGLAAAQCGIAKVAATHDDVRLLRAGGTAAPVVGEPVCTGDRIVTGARGVAELHFRDGTRITVGKDSEFGVTTWKERALRRNEVEFSLVKGAFRAVTGAITQRRNRFEVQTTIATIGVRGTDFWGGTNLSPDALEVIMLSGKGVYVSNAAGTTEIREAGTGVTVPAGGAPAAAQAWDEQKVGRAVATITP